MGTIESIIKALDEYMRKEKIDNITPSEATKWLEREGLLPDSKQRPVLPLRRLLRAKKIPHAYQEGGKYNRWVIPRLKEGLF